jgi:hypothetical protein
MAQCMPLFCGILLILSVKGISLGSSFNQGGNMKSILVLILAFSTSIAWGFNPGSMISDAEANAISCDQNMSIPDHMSQMGFIIRDLAGMVDSIIDNKDIRDHVLLLNQKLRAHLVAVFNQTPEKIKNIEPSDLQASKIVYQRYIHKMLGYSIELENELLKKPVTPGEQQSQNIKIAALIIDVHETVEEAHKKFRF